MEAKPKYIEIHEWIKKQIISGELKPGERMYSENELMEMFSVSRQTVRHAISRLEFEEFVVRKRGSGTYIREKKEQEKRVNSMQIAVVTTYIDEYIFPGIIREIERTVSKEGYGIQFASTHNSIESEREVLRRLLRENTVDGIVVEATKSALPNPNLPLYRQILERNIPLVFINSYYPEIQAPHVSMNDRMAGKMAAQYLIRKGHRKIGAIFKCDDGQGYLRYAGFVEAMMEARIPIREGQVIWISTEDGRRMRQEEDRYLGRLEDNTAYVCYNDKVAMEFIEILEKHQIRVPDNISVVGIDNAEISLHHGTALTTVQNPLQSLGELTATVMLKMIHGIPVEKDYELMPTMVERMSVKNRHRSPLSMVEKEKILC